MPGNDESFGILAVVDDCEKMRREFPSLFLDRKVLLVVAHHRDQDFIGEFEEAFIKAAEDYGWKFIQIGHLFEQRFILVNAESIALHQRRDFVLDFQAPLFGADHNAVRAQLLLVVVQAADADLGRAKKTVPRGNIRRR